MWFCKKKEIVQVKKKRIIYKKETFEIGKTFLHLTFNDSSTFTTSFVGDVYQHVTNNFLSPIGISPVFVNTSKDVVYRFMTTEFRRYNSSSIQEVFLDCPVNPTVCAKGVIKKAKLGKTISFKQDFEVAYIEEI